MAVHAPRMSQTSISREHCISIAKYTAGRRIPLRQLSTKLYLADTKRSPSQHPRDLQHLQQHPFQPNLTSNNTPADYNYFYAQSIVSLP